MSNRTNTTRWAAAAVATAVSILIGGCGSTTQTPENVSYDMPTFSSFTGVIDAADLVVAARVTDETMEVTDTGGNDVDGEALANGAAVEQRLVRISIRKTILGDAGADEVWVGQPEMESQQNTLLRAGDAVVLALDEQTTENAPSVFEKVGRHWAPVSLNFGIARLDGTRLIPLIEDMDELDVSVLTPE